MTPLSQSQKNIVRVFSNYERLRLVCCLEKPHSVTDLLKKCSFSQSALSQHLSVLRNAGVVSCNRKGKTVIYKVKNNNIVHIAKMVASYIKKS